MRNVLCSALILATGLAVACSGDDDVDLDPTPGPGSDASTGTPDATSKPDAAGGDVVELRFDAKVGELPFSCDRSFELGTPATDAVIRDLRAYVHQVELIDAAGARVPFELVADGLWQTERVALLDFENGAGNCRNGTPETNLVLRGRVAPGDYRGVAFRIGVPQDLNHLDPSLASSPLTLTTMHWTWNAGYIFARVDAERVVDADAGAHGDGGMGMDGGMDMGDGGMDMGDGGMSHGPAGVFLMHLGSAGCTGEATAGQPVTCSHVNIGAVELSGFDPRTSPITVDVAALFAASDLGAEDQGGSPGCMSTPTDPECGPLFPRIGVDADGALSPSTQTMFRAP